MAWSAVLRFLVVFGIAAVVGTGCADDDSASVSAGSESSAVAGDVDVDPGDDADIDDSVPHDDADMDDADMADHDDADMDDADMVVEIVMSDFAFALEDLVVPVGSTVRFDFVNDGVIEHEAMFGDAHQQEEFAELGDHGDVGTHHGEVEAITLDAGGSGSVTVTFDEVGEMMIGCHLPGHWDAGMSATFVVA